jgi:hypothetical protein
MTDYMVLTSVGPHSPGSVVTDARIPDDHLDNQPMNRTNVIGRLLALGAVRLATDEEVAAATTTPTGVEPLAVSNPIFSPDAFGGFPGTFGSELDVGVIRAFVAEDFDY